MQMKKPWHCYQAAENSVPTQMGPDLKDRAHPAWIPCSQAWQFSHVASFKYRRWGISWLITHVTNSRLALLQGYASPDDCIPSGDSPFLLKDLTMQFSGGQVTRQGWNSRLQSVTDCAFQKLEQDSQSWIGSSAFPKSFKSYQCNHLMLKHLNTSRNSTFVQREKFLNGVNF